MTIPQGDNRGTQSVSERRKVTFASDSHTSGQLPTPLATTTNPNLDEENLDAVATEGACDTYLKGQEEVSGTEEGLLNLKTDKLNKSLKDNKNQILKGNEHLEVNVTVVSQKEHKKSALPLLNFLKTDDSLSGDRTRKLSLNLSSASQSKGKSSASCSTEKLRRYSHQPQKSSYQKVPLEDPSPPSHTLDPKIFTLQKLGQTNLGFKQHPNLATHSAEVHAPYRDREVFDGKGKGLKLGIKSVSRDSSTSKRVFFGKQKALSRSRSSSSKSLDDLVLIQHGGASNKTKSSSTNRSASSEDLSASRKKRVAGSSGSGGNYPRRQPGDPHPSPGSPSHCCLVSVSRVPMAAATSHLTLDSDYQTVRLAVLGAPGVGKSSIVRQFVMQQFMEEYVPTEQRQVFCPAVIINEHLYEVRIIDCPYIPYFPVNSLYEWTDFRGYGLRNATAYVLVYDITSEESFEYIKSLRLQIIESRNRHDVPIFVVGNKHDLAEERGVPRREVREVANLVKKQWKCGYIECSAKYNWHIMLLFKELMKTVDYNDYGHKPTSMRVQDALRRNRCLIL